MHILPLQYPKTLLLLASFASAYAMGSHGLFDDVVTGLNGHEYMSVFIGGALLSFGFTSAFGMGVLLSAADLVHPFIAAVLAALGAMIVDVSLFSFLRFSFQDEVDRFRTTRIFQSLFHWFHHESVSERLRRYLIWSVGGLIIASPLPDEIGVMLLSGVHEMNTRTFAAVCFLFNACGILAFLLLGRML